MTLAAQGCVDRPVIDMPADSAPRAGTQAKRATPAQAGAPATTPRSSMSTSSAQAAAAAGSRAEPAQITTPTTAAPTDPPSYGWTTVRGKPIGQGKTTAKELRKAIKVSVTGEPDYDVISAYAVRDSLTSIGTNVIVEIVNRGSKLHCFVQADPIGYKDKQGASIKVISTLSFASGAIGVNADNENTDTCLGPGEGGYFLEIELMSKNEPSLFDQVAEVSLNLQHMDFDYVRPKFRFSALGYTVDGKNLSVKLRNEGPDPVPVDQNATFRYVFMDADDQPLMWGFMDVQNKGAAAAGETITATTDGVYYDGTADHMRVAVELSTK